MKIDHIVFVAKSLSQARDYARARWGVDMPAGGAHALMGTHNLVARIAPDVFLEFIAIDPQAVPPRHARWFALDRLAREGALENAPRLFGWVADLPGLGTFKSQLGAQRIIEISRDHLRWHFSLREDGEAEFDGAFPSFIDWTGGSPVGAMKEVGLRLDAFQVMHPEMHDVVARLRNLGWPGVADANRRVHLLDGLEARLTLALQTPNGLVEIDGGAL